MNNLSWLLYFANITDGIKGLMGAIVFILVIMSVLLLCYSSINFDIGHQYNDDKDKTTGKKGFKIVFFNFFPAILIASLIGILTPSKETIYAIAVSEMGEEVLNSNIGNKSMKALETWLDNQIDDLKGEVHEEVIEKEGK